MYYYNFSYNPLIILATLCFGALIWTFLEYVFHRFVFHGEDYWMAHVPHNKWVFSAHFFVHGIHHAFPQDRFRIVFPPVVGQVLVMYPILYRGFKACIPEMYFYNIFLGFTIGYVLYEMTHYSLHHFSPKSGYFRDLKMYHMQHHYKFGTVGFGVSSKFWDIIFRTEIDMNNKTRNKKDN
jgi:4-hydroxysphinganine ceramide fatty acyl 2-hydroxylase